MGAMNRTLRGGETIVRVDGGPSPPAKGNVYRVVFKSWPSDVAKTVGVLRTNPTTYDVAMAVARRHNSKVGHAGLAHVEFDENAAANAEKP